MRYLEIQFWRLAKRIITSGYGVRCTARDLDNEPDAPVRCAVCYAWDTIDWIDQHIDLLRK